MQTAVIIIQSPPFYGCGEVLDELSLKSEADEARFLPPAKDIDSLLYGYAACAKALLVCVEKEIVADLSAALSVKFNDFLQCGDDGSGVFTQEGFDLFLFSLERERRSEFLNNVCLPRMRRRGLLCEKLVFRMIGAEREKIVSCAEKCKRVLPSGETLEFRVSERFDDFRVEVRYGTDAPKTLLDGVTRLFAESFSENLYALDDTPIEKRLCELLKVRGKKISVAESFTGGGVGSRIVSVPGASEVYFEGLNTYDCDAKIKRLNVSPYTLNTLGAVSDQTAYEMCAGLLSTGDCGAAIATTGLAGPKSDDSGLPVGLCFLAAGAEGKIYIARHLFTGTREEITEKAINHALFWAYRHLK